MTYGRETRDTKKAVRERDNVRLDHIVTAVDMQYWLSHLHMWLRSDKANQAWVNKIYMLF